MTDSVGLAKYNVQWWAFLIPAVSIALMIVALIVPMGLALAVACALALIGAVIAAVHHAEVIAHRIGEPYGTLVLSISITIIEVAAPKEDAGRRAHAYAARGGAPGDLRRLHIFRAGAVTCR
jgi:hypothetical protein